MDTDLCFFVTFGLRVLGKSVMVDKSVILQLLVSCSFQHSDTEQRKAHSKIIFLYTRGAVKASNVD